MEQFLEQYGYYALMVATFFEGETAILLASSLIHDGIFGIPFTILFGFAGSFVSDWLYYGIGHFNGKYLLSKKPKLERAIAPVQKFFQKHTIQVLLTYRFLYGFRVIIPMSIGLSKIKPTKFLLFSIVSGLMWASIVSGVGLVLGKYFNLNAAVVEKNILYVAGGFASIGLLAGYFIKSFFLRKINSENHLQEAEQINS